MTTQIPTDAEAFHAFLTRQLSGSGRDKAPEELLQVWRQEYAEAVHDIREGIQEMEAGKMRPLRDVDAELRKRYNIPRDE